MSTIWYTWKRNWTQYDPNGQETKGYRCFLGETGPDGPAAFRGGHP